MNNNFLIILLVFAQLVIVQKTKAQQNAADSLAQTVQLLYNTKSPEHLTGAVSYVSGENVSNVPGINRINALSGRLTGFTNYNVDGLPGYENSTVRVRGVHTFSGNRDPLVLIDGNIDDLHSLDPYDIESVVVLKDAVSTALYGLRSTNGIILINTKKGKAGKMKINFNMETSFSQPTRLPKYLDAYQYATLYNEAQLNDDPTATPRYSDEALEAYRTGSDPYKYPNVNWVDEFLKKDYTLTRTNINVSGGGNTAKYYFSANYLHNSGVFNTDKSINTYNTNTAVNVMNVHGNVQLNLWKNLFINADIRAKKDKRNAPGSYNVGYATALFTTMFSTPFNAHPILNEDGSIAGTNDYQSNPYGMLNYKGYSIWERSSLSSFLNLSFDLSDLVKGLSIEGRVGFNSYTDYYINRTKNFASFSLNADGTYRQYGNTTTLGNGGGYLQIVRNFDHYLGLRYARDFAAHHVDALLMYQRQQVMDGQIRFQVATQNFQGPKGTVSYRYNDTYLLDLSFAYQGSEQYPKNNRFGFFPAAAVGWVVSKESFMKNAGLISLLKLRGSYGLTGNQTNTYFAYLSRFTSGGGYVLGTNPAAVGGYYENQVANPALTWEKSLKTDAGLDIALFKNRLSGSFDYFRENNRDILIQNAITAMYGGSNIYMPEGKFENKGYEFQIGWNDHIRKFSYFVNVNYSFAQNKIVYQNEVYREYPWMYRTGHSVGTWWGYVFDRFYTENDNIASLPDQSALGVQRPGDLKYKDLNNDGVIDDKDQQAIGSPKLPTTTYGFSFGGEYGGFDFSVFFHGTRGGSLAYAGYTAWDFVNRTGNVMEHHLDRWQPGDGQSAGYPRLSLTNANNYTSSNYWIRDYSFLRLKYAEIGYTLPAHLSKKAGMSKTRLFVNGNNLYCWDKIGIFDPELTDGGISFPIQRTFSAGINVSF